MAKKQSEAENQEEQKEGKISGFFKKVGKKIDEATYPARLQSDFDSSHPKYTVYSGTGVFDATPEIAVEEHLVMGYLLTLDDDKQIREGNLIKTPKGEVYHIDSVKKTTMQVKFEEKDNEVDALKIVLGKQAKEVNVIKVGDKFYLAK